MPILKFSIMFVYLVLFLSGIFGLSREIKEWRQWKQRHGKTYPSLQVEQQHMEIWIENYRYVQDHNNKTDVTFEVELNSFADQVIQSFCLLVVFF